MSELEIGDMTRTIRTQVTECECHADDEIGPCWVWNGAVDSSGYASFKSRGKVHIVHRWVYDRYVGPIELEGDDDATIDHLCLGHRNCIRPSHMEIVSRVENSVRANVRRNELNYRRKDTT